jgi:hypothetical protein
MVEASKKYALTGVHGAEVFRDLPEGLELRMLDGSIVEILANARDGAVLIVKVLENENDPSTVGEEQTILFADVQEVVQ